MFVFCYIEDVSYSYVYNMEWGRIVLSQTEQGKSVYYNLAAYAIPATGGTPCRGDISQKVFLQPSR